MKLLISVWMILTGILLSSSSQAQQANTKENISTQVSGFVRDAWSGQPVPNVSISNEAQVVLGLSKEDGSFSVTVSKGTTLVFTAVSYTPHSIQAQTSESGKSILLIDDNYTKLWWEK